MSCSCGRSPTGKCVGWHNLSEADYLVKKMLGKKSKQLRNRLPKDFLESENGGKSMVFETLA
jgi:hypothetical protein